MDASTDISSPSPPNKGSNNGIFGRLLRRAKSTKESTRSRPKRSAEQPDNLPGQVLTHGAEGVTANLEFSHLLSGVTPQELQHERPQTSSGISQTRSPDTRQPHQANVPDTIIPQHHQQRQPRSQEIAPAMPVQMAQPLLKKKASFRDRLKSWQKPAPSATVTPDAFAEQPKPRFVYQPKHAAADFSRMVVSPTAPTQRRVAKESFDEDRTLSPSIEQVDARHAVPPLEDDAHLVLKTRRLSPPLQTLVENEAVSEGRPRQRHGKQRETSKKDPEDPLLQRSRSGARHSYKLVEDPWEASQAAAHVPIGSIPVRSLTNRTTKTQLHLDNPSTPHPKDAQPPLGPSETEPLSEFEAFLAQAEAEDRAHRELILRSFSHHSAAHTSTNYVKPNPHRQYATVAGGDLSGTTIGAGRTSAGGSRSSRGGSQRTSGQYYALAGGDEPQHPFRPGHKKQSSWSPSFGTEGTEAERILEVSPDGRAQQSALPRSRRPQVQPPQPQSQTQQPVVYGVDEGFNQPEQQQPRTLRRQASITQRIAGYIKPARDDVTASGGSEQTMYRSGSRSGPKRSGSQRQSKGIETLVE